MPPSLFNLCQDNEHIFSLSEDNDTNFPITALILAIACGCRVELDSALLNAECASVESRIALCNALAVALTQTLVWMDLDEVSRVDELLRVLAKQELIVFDRYTGYRAYFELLKKATELVFDDQGIGFNAQIIHTPKYFLKLNIKSAHGCQCSILRPSSNT